MNELFSQGFTQNRELSWLRFNERVLSEATDETNPLLERLKFISIFTSNLDEFFMIRVGSLFDMMSADPRRIDNKSGMTPEKQLKSIFETVKPLYKKREKIFFDVEKKLREYGICQAESSELTDREKKTLNQYFKTSLEGVLSPQIVDNLHPFPHFTNNALHIGVMLKYKDNKIFGYVPIPDFIPSLFFFPGNEVRYMRIESILLEYIDTLFKPYEVEQKVIFCVTRNADVNPDDEVFADESDLRKRMKKVLGMRKRLAPVRLEISNPISKSFHSFFMEKLGLGANQIFRSAAPLKMGYVFQLISKIPKTIQVNLLYEKFSPVWTDQLRRGESIIRQIRKKDVLLSYPYESMEPFIRLLDEAAENKDVLSIKITIYRLASHAKLVDALCRAAENGKNVTVLIELRARFDEQNNIDWSKLLEDAGCNIIYGFDFYKVHSKICLITMKDKDSVSYITQVGTGNYNEKTAKLYTDLSLITSNKEIGKDASEFFKNMSIGNLNGEYRHLWVSPSSLKTNVLKCFDEEIAKGRAGHITIKINSLTDADIIQKLSEASRASVQIKMIIRGICCILPGVINKTDNIKIYSIVGRFLEHSRIYCFGSGNEEKMYISSADFMTRNTERRVEVACPVYSEHIRKKIHNILDAHECDTLKARQVSSDGSYVFKSYRTEPYFDSQKYLLEQAKSEITVQNNSFSPVKYFTSVIKSIIRK